MFEARIKLSEEDFEIDPKNLTNLREIGRGNFGVIHLMRWKSQKGEEHEVAVKSIQSDSKNFEFKKA